MVKQNSKVFLEENFLKRHETAVVDELDRGVRNKWVWAWLDCQDANEDFYASYIRKLNVPGQAVCTICNRGGGKVINYSECGIQAVTNTNTTNFKAICTSTTSPHIARARFLEYRHRTWEGNTGYALSCRPVSYTCM